MRTFVARHPRLPKSVSESPESDDALLRLASAVLMEVDEGWMAGRKYLTMETH